MKDASGSSLHRLLIKGNYPILMISMKKQNPNHHVRNLTPTLTPPSVKNKSRAKSRELIFKMLENQHNSQSLLDDFRHVILFPRGYSTLCPLDKMDDFRDK